MCILDARRVLGGRPFAQLLLTLLPLVRSTSRVLLGMGGGARRGSLRVRRVDKVFWVSVHEESEIGARCVVE